MRINVIEGVVALAEVQRSSRFFTRYLGVEISGSDGRSEAMKGALAHADVAQHLALGAKGKFYLFSDFDMKGVFGVRLADGTSVREYPGKNNLNIYRIMLFAGLALLLLSPFILGGVSVLALLASLVGGGLWFMADKARKELLRAFDSD